MRVRAVQESYDQLVAQVRARVAEYLQASWLRANSFREADVDKLVAQVLPTVLAGQRTVSQLTNTYLLQVRVAVGGSKPRHVPATEASGPALRGVAMEEEYRRPAVTVRTALSAGKTFQDAAREGAARLIDLAMTDLQLAKTHTVSRSGISTFRRTLSGAENCALCAIASTQRYFRGDLMPIHPGCDCGILEVFSEDDPGQVIDPETLDIVHRSVSSFIGAESDPGARVAGLGKTTPKGPVSDYTDIVVTRIHGEYGPTLSWRPQRFTGPDDI